MKSEQEPLSSDSPAATSRPRLIPPGSGTATRRGTFFRSSRAPDRAVLFVDGNNWFHSLREAGVRELHRLDYAKISLKLVRDRTWLGTRYYVGQVPQAGNLRLYVDQRRFLASLASSDSRISVHLGRLEFRRVTSKSNREHEQRLARLARTLGELDRRALEWIVRNRRETRVVVEKAVDVMLAVDLVLMAERREFETAYLLSADGDFTPAVEAARLTGRQIFAVSASHGGRLREVCNAFIRVGPEWFNDCYRERSDETPT